MSLFDFFGGGDSDKAVGEKILTAYFDEASKFPSFTHASLEAFLVWADSVIPDFAAFVGQLVKSNYASTTIDEAANRLVDLASQTSGTARLQDIVSAAGGQGNTVNWVGGIPEIAAASGSQIVSAVQNVGTGVLSTANLMKYLPWILGAGAGLYIFTLAKSSGSTIKKLTGGK